MKNNEMAMAVLCAKKALENKEGGIVFAKGTPLQTKMAYKKALECFDKLDTYFRYKGTFSKGCCGTCDRFNQSGVQSQFDEFGRCGAGGKTVHVYDTCDSHGSGKREKV